MRLLLGLFVCFTVLLSGRSWGDEEKFSELRKELNDRSFKVRKVAFKKATNLPLKDLEKFIVTLKASKEPELELVAEKLEEILDELKENTVLDLPTIINFAFDEKTEKPEFHYLRFTITFLKKDVDFKMDELVLNKIVVDGKVFESDALSTWDFYSRDRGDLEEGKWNLRQGCDQYIPLESGDYKVEFHFNAPGHQWKKTINFKRKTKNLEAAKLFDKFELYKFFHPGLYNLDITDDEVKKLFSFYKKYPKHSTYNSLVGNLNWAVMNLAREEEIDFKKVPMIFEISNRLSSSLVVNKLTQEESYAGNEFRRNRIKELRKFVKEKYSETKALRVEMPKSIFPMQNKLKVFFKGKNRNFLYMKLHKILINGKEIHMNSRESWERKKVEKNQFYLYPPINVMPFKEGEYKLTVFVTSQGKIFKLNDVQFSVEVPKEEREAYEFFLANNLSDLRLLRDYEENSINLAQEFCEQFPKSYFKQSIIDSLITMIKLDLGGRIWLKTDERESICRILVTGDFSKVMQNVGMRFRSYMNNPPRKLKFQDWLRFLSPHVKEADSSFSIYLGLEEAKIRPNESLDIKCSWKAGFKIDRTALDLVAIEWSDEYFSTMNFGESTYGQNSKTLNGIDGAWFHELGDFNLAFYFYTGDEIVKVSGFKLSVWQSEDDEKVYQEIDDKLYEDLITRGTGSSFVVKKHHEKLFDLLVQYPKSYYTEHLSQVFQTYAYGDINGWNNMSDEDRQRSLKYIPLIAFASNKKMITRKWKGKYDKKLLKLWQGVLSEGNQ